ncbi:PGM_PMM_I domain-containing protein/PGM_PMM_II domain-containing protein/PGM_PMM_III domain-containing protein [Cephalotus follicularis]|uniref:phosphoglucomutase (alpha-D-glucose-1,6-bisphosphate-dependent) n=1 Tax=Cephalotus follicularis TaxID=3775 RepID=A0A1Q3BYJ4_CEPFO|nr:PGM_PMM_I domain-containing protein/PGM_PMM_II domain-containing protein/PGM_PMM_III domain-containing protein [Cephalotus follicularis]
MRNTRGETRWALACAGYQLPKPHCFNSPQLFFFFSFLFLLLISLSLSLSSHKLVANSIYQMAALSGKIVQNVFVAQYYQQNRQFATRSQMDCFSPCVCNLLPFQGGKLAWTSISSMQMHTLAKHQSHFINRGIIYCKSVLDSHYAAAPSTSAIPSLDKVDFRKLQNGSDIRGVAVAGVEGEPVSLAEPVAEAIAAAFCTWLLEKEKAHVPRRLRISIGHDSRISAQMLQDAVSRGIAGAGLDVVQYGLASTPAMFNCTLTDDEAFLCPVDGAIMITASHLPYNRNGFKFFTSAGGLGKVDIKDILERAADIYSNFTNEGLMDSKRKAAASVKKVDYMTVYTSDLVKAVRKAAGNLEKPLEGFHIVVDAGNGAGGFFAAKVLQPLGAITSGSQFLEPDGLFPNHIPNPEDQAAMRAITEAVLENKADLGIIFDTDVDRSAAVDSSGREFNRNRLIALMSAIVLEEHPGTTIVTDSVTSDGLTKFIEKKLGGKHHRFKRGYKNVIDEAIRLNSVGEESHLAIETSGHGALKENHWLDDGAYLMVKLLNKLASARASGIAGGSKVLTELIGSLQEPAVAMELRLKINQDHPDLKGGSFREYGEAVLQHLENYINSDPKLQKAPVSYEGVRVSGFGGWFLLRLSLHDPVLPLNIEAPSTEDAVRLGLAVAAAVKEFQALDTSALNKFVQLS